MLLRQFSSTEKSRQVLIDNLRQSKERELSSFWEFENLRFPLCMTFAPLSGFPASVLTLFSYPEYYSYPHILLVRQKWQIHYVALTLSLSFASQLVSYSFFD